MIETLSNLNDHDLIESFVILLAGFFVVIGLSVVILFGYF